MAKQQVESVIVRVLEVEKHEVEVLHDLGVVGVRFESTQVEMRRLLVIPGGRWGGNGVLWCD